MANKRGPNYEERKATNEALNQRSDFEKHDAQKHRTDFEKVIPKDKMEELKALAEDKWDAEIALLEYCYDHEDIFTKEKDLWKEIKFRNNAIISQINHLKKLATFLGGVIPISDAQTKKGADAEKKLTTDALKKVEEQKKKWDKRKKDIEKELFDDGTHEHPPHVGRTGEAFETPYDANRFLETKERQNEVSS